VKLKVVLTKWLANNVTTEGGVPYILLWDVGDMRFDVLMLTLSSLSPKSLTLTGDITEV
jgi:hypothetical protein